MDEVAKPKAKAKARDGRRAGCMGITYLNLMNNLHLTASTSVATFATVV